MLQSKRLTTYAMVRDEIADVVQARAATGSSPMLVDALAKGKGKGKEMGERQGHEGQGRQGQKKRLEGQM